MTSKPTVMLACALVSASALAQSTQTDVQRKALETEVWEPVPERVATPLNAAPSDAVVLFDGTDLSAWESESGGAPGWSVADGVVTVVPGSQGIRSKESFCDVQLHLEWRTPTPAAGSEGQNRSNSGVFLQDRYELQILDSYESKTYANGQAASIYKQAIPLVNATRAPGQWQSYDIIWTAPRFSQGGGLLAPARMTVLHNGVLVQNNTVIAGKTEYSGAPSYSPHDCAPLSLQDHGDKISFRNIWVRKL